MVINKCRYCGSMPKIDNKVTGMHGGSYGNFAVVCGCGAATKYVEGYSLSDYAAQNIAVDIWNKTGGSDA